MSVGRFCRPGGRSLSRSEWGVVCPRTTFCLTGSLVTPPTVGLISEDASLRTDGDCCLVFSARRSQYWEVGGPFVILVRGVGDLTRVYLPAITNICFV